MHSNIVATGFVIRSWNCQHKRANLFNRKRQFKRYTKLNLKKVHWPRYNWGSGLFHYVDDEDNPEVVHCWWPKNAITATSAFTDHEYNSMRLQTNAYRHATNIILKIAFLFQLNFFFHQIKSNSTTIRESEVLMTGKNQQWYPFVSVKGQCKVRNANQDLGNSCTILYLSFGSSNNKIRIGWRAATFDHNNISPLQ